MAAVLFSNFSEKIFDHCCRFTWNMNNPREILHGYRFFMNVPLKIFQFVAIFGLIILTIWTRHWRFCILSFLLLSFDGNILAFTSSTQPTPHHQPPTPNFVQYEIWQTSSSIQVGKVVKDAHLRATKNCPWVGELWVGYLLCLERGRSSEEEISTVCIDAFLTFLTFCVFGSHEIKFFSYESTDA